MDTETAVAELLYYILLGSLDNVSMKSSLRQGLVFAESAFLRTVAFSHFFRSYFPITRN